MLKKSKGFTLIELLVVIAIIGILATVVIINVIGAQKKARLTNALSNANEALKVASSCIIDEGNLVTANLSANLAANVSGGTSICSGSTSSINANWPTVPANYRFAVTGTLTSITGVKLCGSAADGDAAACATTPNTASVQYSCNTSSCSKAAGAVGF